MSQDLPPSIPPSDDLAALLTLMMVKGVDEVRMHYEGSADEGSVKSVTFLDVSGEKVSIGEQHLLVRKLNRKGTPYYSRKAISDICVEVCDDLIEIAGNTSYEDNNGGYGDIVIKSTGEVRSDHVNRYTESQRLASADFRSSGVKLSEDNMVPDMPAEIASVFTELANAARKINLSEFGMQISIADDYVGEADLYGATNDTDPILTGDRLLAFIEKQPGGDSHDFEFDAERIVDCIGETFADNHFQNGAHSLTFSVSMRPSDIHMVNIGPVFSMEMDGVFDADAEARIFTRNIDVSAILSKVAQMGYGQTIDRKMKP